MYTFNVGVRPYNFRHKWIRIEKGDGEVIIKMIFLMSYLLTYTLYKYWNGALV